MKNYIISGIVAIVVILVGVTLTRQPTQPTPKPSLGSVASPDIQSPYYTVGGSPEWGNRSVTLIASTTPYTYQTPPATTTLEDFTCTFRVASSSATTVTLAKSTVPNATTTFLASASISGGAQGTVVASTSALGSLNPDGPDVFAPNTYLTMGIANAISTGDAAPYTGFVPSGSCNVRVIQP